jgi:hypothetical protein
MSRAAERSELNRWDADSGPDQNRANLGAAYAGLVPVPSPLYRLASLAGRQSACCAASSWMAAATVITATSGGHVGLGVRWFELDGKCREEVSFEDRVAPRVLKGVVRQSYTEPRNGSINAGPSIATPDPCASATRRRTARRPRPRSRGLIDAPSKSSSAASSPLPLARVDLGFEARSAQRSAR